MKIGFVSDTHGSLSAWLDAVRGPLSGCNYIVHCGDVLYHGPRNPIPAGHDPGGLAAAINDHGCPVILARGNCDADIDGVLIKWPLLSPYAFIQIEGTRILAVHDVPGPAEETIARFEIDLLVTGHTHVSRLDSFGDAVWLNPGSPILPKDANRSVAVWQDGVLKVIDLPTGAVLRTCTLKGRKTPVQK